MTSYRDVTESEGSFVDLSIGKSVGLSLDFSNKYLIILPRDSLISDNCLSLVYDDGQATWSPTSLYVRVLKCHQLQESMPIIEILVTYCITREQTVLEGKIFIKFHICFVDNNSLFCHNLDPSYAMVTIFCPKWSLTPTHHDY